MQCPPSTHQPPLPPTVFAAWLAVAGAASGSGCVRACWVVAHGAELWCAQRGGDAQLRDRRQRSAAVVSAAASPARRSRSCVETAHLAGLQVRTHSRHRRGAAVSWTGRPSGCERRSPGTVCAPVPPPLSPCPSNLGWLACGQRHMMQCELPLPHRPVC